MNTEIASNILDFILKLMEVLCDFFFFCNSSIIIRELPFICLNKPLQNMKILPLNFALAYYMINSVLVFDSCMIKALVFAEE